MARTTKELIDEIEAEGKRFTSLFLVCRFEKHTEQVEHSATHKLDRLNDMVARGGIPYATIGYVMDDKGEFLNVYSRLLKEYEGDDEALSFLQEFLPTIDEAIPKSGLTPRYMPTGQWLQSR